MKIRSGFVSNSSSSSFLLYGIYMDKDEILDLTELSDDEKEEIELYDFFDDGDVEVWCPYDDSYAVGVSWHNVGDDQTGAQFKEEVYNKLKKLLPKLQKESLGTHEESWRDG